MQHISITVPTPSRIEPLRGILESSTCSISPVSFRTCVCVCNHICVCPVRRCTFLFTPNSHFTLLASGTTNEHTTTTTTTGVVSVFTSAFHSPHAPLSLHIYRVLGGRPRRPRSGTDPNRAYDVSANCEHTNYIHRFYSSPLKGTIAGVQSLSL